MPIPEAPRVIYKRNPLDQVICQLRFPPILRIDAEIPANFQEKIRKGFPHYSEVPFKMELPPALQGKIPPQAVDQVFNALRSSGNKNHEFTSADENWKVNLSRTFIALTARNYERWEQFREKLELPFNALIDTYGLDNFSRIGLRYVDVFRRSSLGLDGVGWEQLLQPFIIGILNNPDVRDEDEVKSYSSTCELNLPEQQGSARVGASVVQHVDSGERCYMIDSDFFDSNTTSIDRALDRLEHLHSYASRLIRWCITDLLHQAMEPQSV